MPQVPCEWIGVGSSGSNRDRTSVRPDSSVESSSDRRPVSANSAVVVASATAGRAALSGSVTADGSSTVGPYAIAAAEGFQKKNPGAHVTVSNELRDQLARTLDEDERRIALAKPEGS